MGALPGSPGCVLGEGWTVIPPFCSSPSPCLSLSPTLSWVVLFSLSVECPTAFPGQGEQVPPPTLSSGQTGPGEVDRECVGMLRPWTSRRVTRMSPNSCLCSFLIK